MEEVYEYTVTDGLNTMTDVFFLIDIILNFRTTITHTFTGEELIDPVEIAKYYLGFQFWLDLVSAVPVD